MISVNSPGCVSMSIEPPLFDDDVVTDAEAEARPFACGFGRKERIEDLFLTSARCRCHCRDRDLHTVAEAFCSGGEGRLVVASFVSALRLVAA